MAKGESIGAIAFAVVFVGILVGGGGYLYVKYKPVDPLVQAEEHLKSARRLANGGSFMPAVEEFTAAIQLNPDLSKAYRGRGEALLTMQDYYGAINDLGEALMADPDDSEALLLRARAYRGVEEFDNALNDLDRLLVLDPENRSTHRMFAAIHLSQGRYQLAAEHARRSLARVPSDSSTNRSLGWANWGLGKYEDALEPFSRAIDNDPFNLHGFFGRGVTKSFLGDFEGALEDLQAAVNSDQQRTDYPHFYLYLTQLRLGHEDAARKTLRLHQRNRRPARGADWPGSIGAFLLGEMTEDELFERVNETGDPPDPELVVEGCYYAGSLRLLRGDREGAIALFRSSVETRVHSFYEYHSAVAELRALGEMPESESESDPE